LSEQFIVMGDIVRFYISKKTSIMAAGFLLPLLFVFQNCGQSSSSSDSSKSSSESKNRSSRSSLSSGTSSFGGGGSGGGGTFSYGGTSGGGSSNGGTTGGYGNGSGGNGGGSGSNGGSFSDGVNCFKGPFGHESQTLSSFNGGNGLSLSIRRMLPLREKKYLNSPAAMVDFDDAEHSDTQPFSCSVAFEKFRYLFPSEFFSSRYECSGNENNNIVFQCRNGEWSFAGSSCNCRLIPVDKNGGGGRDR
jgi:hypothetical protein